MDNQELQARLVRAAGAIAAADARVYGMHWSNKRLEYNHCEPLYIEDDFRAQAQAVERALRVLEEE